MIERMFKCAVLVVIGSCASQMAALAGQLMVSSGGQFSGSVSTTPYSAPNATWSFSFSVADTPSVSNPDGIGFDVPYTGFTYVLNGSTSFPTPARIRFFTFAAGGLVSVNFVDDGNPDDFPTTGFVFDGAAAFTGTTSAPTIVPMVYTASSGTFYPNGQPCNPAASCQDLTNTVVDITAVPEPGTLMILAAACGLLGWMRQTRRTV